MVDLDKIVKATKMIGLVALATCAIGYSTPAFSQIENKSTNNNLYQSEVFNSKSAKDKPLIYQYDIQGPDTIKIDLNKIRGSVKDKKPVQLFIFRAETSFEAVDKEISPLESHLDSYSPYVHIESFEIKRAYGANMGRFKITLNNEKEIARSAAPPTAFIYVSDTALLNDIIKNSGIEMLGSNMSSRDGRVNRPYDFEKDYVGFHVIHSKVDFFEKVNKLVSYINKREFFEQVRKFPK